jgi:hypothetical protein
MAANKQLHISESRGDSIRCTPCKGNLTNTPHASHAQYTYGPRLPCGQRIVIFHVVVNRVEQGHCSQEKGLPTQSTARRSIDPQVHTQFLT